MKEYFEYILKEYNTTGKVIDKNNEVFCTITHKIPSEIRDFIKDDLLLVKGSMGQANKSDCPWISILNPNITRTTQSGLYIVYLFKKDMSGFYLTLNQGIKNFQDLFHNKKYEYAVKVANYFKEEITETSFSKNRIYLGEVKPGQRAYGYEKTTILSKYYPKGQYDTLLLQADLIELLNIYNTLAKLFSSSSYNDVIKPIVSCEQPISIDGDTAIQKIKDYVDPNDELTLGFRKTLCEQTPFVDRMKKFSRLTKPQLGKIDYMKKTYKDMKTGLMGEALVLNYEKEKLIKLGREDLECKVKWISRESDAYGYDIESFDIDENGKEYPIKIEVKSTVSKLDVEFYVSKNEIEASKKYKKKYCVYRLYDINSLNPKFYKAYGILTENFILDPITFMARYRYIELK